MSCHNIGRGLNTVTRKTVELLDAGEITREVAKELLITARDGVAWCDGNSYEAIAYISQNRCGYCLEVIEPGKPMYDLWDIHFHDYIERNQLIDKTDKDVVSTYLCPKCFDKILNEYMQDHTAGETQRKYIDENVELKERVAMEVPSGPDWNFIY